MNMKPESTSEISEIFWNNVMISLAKIQKMQYTYQPKPFQVFSS